MYPNPLKEVLHIVGDGHTKGKTIIEIFDAVGNLKYYQRLDLDEQITTLAVDEVSNFVSGNYLLIIQTREDTYTFKLAKVQK